MSKWCSGKLQLKCSIDVLRRALIGVRPDWEQSIVVDPSGQLSMFRYDKSQAYNGSIPQTVNILIPGGGNPHHKGVQERNLNNDWGFRKLEGDEWEVTYGDYGTAGAIQLQNEIKGRVLMMKAQALAKLRGHQILNKTEDENEEIMDISCSKEEARHLMT